MVKGMKVGRPSFEKMFASVILESVSVNYAQAHNLGEVYEADEDHDGKLILRIRRQLPKGVGVAKIHFARPLQIGMSLGHSYNLSMDYGLRPAVHQEVRDALTVASSDQVDQMFELADKAMFDHGKRQKAMALSIACMGSAVTGKSTELIPVQEVIRSCGRPCRVHLRKLDFDAPMFPAQLNAFVSVE